MSPQHGKVSECGLALVCGGECGDASLLKEKDLFTPVCMTSETLVVDYLEACRKRADSFQVGQSEIQR